MMEVLLIGGAVVLGTGLVTVGYGIGTYNTMVIAVNDVNTQWSNVKTEYQRRTDLILNLVATVKGYAKHEKETLAAVIQARAGNFGKTKEAEVKTLQGIDKSLNRLLLLTESYPMLQASESFRDLMDEVKMTENRINIARTDYNETVRDYNILLTVFPKNIIAGLFHFSSEVFFELQDPDAAKAPKINF